MKRLLTYIALVLLICSCASTKQVTYFQDTEQGNVNIIEAASKIRIKPDDKLCIIVNSKDAELMNLFNLPYISQRIGQNENVTSLANSQSLSGYTVAKDGCIDFPVVGKIKIEGLTREEVAATIKDILQTRNLVKDAVVTVDYMNLSISVLGEVTHPGRYYMDRDSYTILDALSAAGDLTIYGLREKVKVLRETGNGRETFTVNICDAGEVITSPVYYMQQNDIIYVEPNEVRVRQSTLNGNNVLSASFWLSIATLVTTITLFFLK